MSRTGSSVQQFMDISLLPCDLCGYSSSYSWAERERHGERDTKQEREKWTTDKNRENKIQRTREDESRGEFCSEVYPIDTKLQN